jgi:hypothetical protein
MEDNLQKKMEYNLKQIGRRPLKKWKTTSKENGRQPKKKIEYELKHNLNKSTLIGCDIIVN